MDTTHDTADHARRLVDGPAPPYHETLVEGFRSIDDKNALGWGVLDGKSELLVTAAIATAINRKAGTRVAHVEFPPRIDLVILRERLESRPGRHLNARSGSIKMRYEAKAGHCFDFVRQHGDDTYLGSHLNEDMARVALRQGAGLFFLYEVSDPTRHLKYFRDPTLGADEAVAVLCRFVTRGTLVGRETMDCGVVDQTEVKIHMCIFDPKEQPNPALGDVR